MTNEEDKFEISWHISKVIFGREFSFRAGSITEGSVIQRVQGFSEMRGCGKIH